MDFLVIPQFIIGLLAGFAMQYVVYLVTGWSVFRVVRKLMGEER